MLDVVPAQYRVKAIRQPRYGCRACEGAVVQAPAPERPLDGGMATEAVIAQVLVAKYSEHLPLYRQAQVFARHGIELDRSTLSLWVGRACWWLEPLYERLLARILGSTKIFADDTPLPVLDPGRGRTKTGRLWAYAVDDRPWLGPAPPAVAYVYAEDRKGERASGASGRLHRHPAGRRLWRLQAPRRRAASGPVRWLAFCWSHCRRYFYECHQATTSPIAKDALERIAELFGDRQGGGSVANRRGASGGPAKRSRPIVDALTVALHAGAGLGASWAGPGHPLRTSGMGRAWCCSSRTAGSSWTRTPSSEHPADRDAAFIVLPFFKCL